MEGLATEYVAGEKDVLTLLEVGNTNRTVASTAMNAASSRSHSLFTMIITQKKADGSLLVGKLSLADLAGSEKVQKSHAAGETLEEAKAINQSLSALGNCINALTQENRQHIPFRDSKLTFILRESLGGNSKTTLLVTCSPHVANREETASTLLFAKRAKSVKLNAKINVQLSADELRALVASLKRELTAVRQTCAGLEAKLEWYEGDKERVGTKVPESVLKAKLASASAALASSGGARGKSARNNPALLALGDGADADATVAGAAPSSFARGPASVAAGATAATSSDEEDFRAPPVSASDEDLRNPMSSLLLPDQNQEEQDQGQDQGQEEGQDQERGQNQLQKQIDDSANENQYRAQDVGHVESATIDSTDPAQGVVATESRSIDPHEQVKSEKRARESASVIEELTGRVISLELKLEKARKRHDKEMTILVERLASSATNELKLECEVSDVKRDRDAAIAERDRMNSELARVADDAAEAAKRHK